MNEKELQGVVLRIVLTELAREELVETGDWLSYVSENQPDILICRSEKPSR